jgi:hypothetical protein
VQNIEELTSDVALYDGRNYKLRFRYYQSEFRIDKLVYIMLLILETYSRCELISRWL